MFGSWKKISMKITISFVFVHCSDLEPYSAKNHSYSGTNVEKKAKLYLSSPKIDKFPKMAT